MYRTFFFMTVNGKRRIGVPTMMNHKTAWFRIMDGARTSYVIKRNYTKHNVTLKEVSLIGDVHTTTRDKDQTS